MDPTQQALIAQLLQSGGGGGNAGTALPLNSNLMGTTSNSPSLGAAGAVPSMGAGGQSAPAWNAGLPPGFSGQQLPPMPPSLYSMTPQQLMQMMGGGGGQAPGMGPLGA